MAKNMDIDYQPITKKIQKTLKKNPRNIWSVRKKAVPLHPVSR